MRKKSFHKKKKSGSKSPSQPSSPGGLKELRSLGPKILSKSAAPSSISPSARISERLSQRPSSLSHPRSEKKNQDQPRFHGKAHASSKKDGKRGDHRWKPARPTLHLKATVDKNRKGFAFLIFDDRSFEDAFVSPEQAQSLFPGDRVEVLLRPPGAILRLKVIEHALKEVVGKYTPHPRGGDFGGWVVYEKKKTREEIFIPDAQVPVVDQDWLRVKLEFKSSGPHPVIGHILENYGNQLPASADLSMIAAEYSLIESHSSEAVKEAQSMTLEIPGRDLQGRVDLREVPFITIDGVHARDFDDAVFVERKKSGFVLWVAIADVSHYVKEGTLLDQEARARGTSVYFPERAFHMLPRDLSENLCSLKPNEPRLALVAKMDFDRLGQRGQVEFMEAVIQSQRRATYEEIQTEWESHRHDPAWRYEAHFALYQLIRKVRSERGSIDFEFPEAEVIVLPSGEVQSISVRPRVDSHRLIEEFMIAANEAVTAWMIEKQWPFVYRIHEEPSFQSLENFKAIAATVGIKVDFTRSREPKILADLVRKLEGHPAQALLSSSLLRSMKQAIYSSTHGIHYGLASEGYTHFTSPIRRYPDLVVHRLVRMVLRWPSQSLGQELSHSQRESLEKELAEICEHTSLRERLASEAERESIRMKQVRLMQTHLGGEFKCQINGVSPSGIYVQVQEPYVEGFIPVESLEDDYYEFIEEKMILLGRRTRRVFRVGESVQVRVVRADLERRQVEFGLLST